MLVQKKEKPEGREWKKPAPSGRAIWTFEQMHENEQMLTIACSSYFEVFLM